MSSFNASFSQNIVIVHPEYFFIIGLTDVSYSTNYYIFLFFIYIIAVIGNSIVLLIIPLERRLHSPKYIGVFNLALADMGGTNALIPNMMKTFFFDSQYISYNACLASMFFMYLFSTMQSVCLVVLAFDRSIAICLPLRYHGLMNNTVMSVVLLVLWVFNSCLIALMVSSITRLSFCESNKISSLFCDHGPVFRLACNDNSMNKFITNLIANLFIIAPLLIIIVSYLGIFLALVKITTWEARLKALKTCISHLLLVGSFFLPIICIYITTSTTSLSSNARIIMTSLAYVAPPMLNPIIYVLNTAEIKYVIQNVCKNRHLLIRKKINQ
ncbi:olfactory receptor 1500-like [Garra rufa]|uniref:olfactory receptor 1500-like n=1 Tax=Garra rufa TaxID=137080 RepID=UPI003CCEB5FA